MENILFSKWGNWIDGSLIFSKGIQFCGKKNFTFKQAIFEIFSLFFYFI